MRVCIKNALSIQSRAPWKPYQAKSLTSSREIFSLKGPLLSDLVNSFIMSFSCLCCYAGLKKDLNVYSRAEWEHLCTPRTSYHWSYWEGHESGILYMNLRQRYTKRLYCENFMPAAPASQLTEIKASNIYSLVDWRPDMLLYFVSSAMF